MSKRMRNILARLWHAPRNAIVLVMRGYQQTLSPDHGPMRHLYTFGYCRHSPTCSQYAIATLTKHGVVWGSILTFRRILSCHPWRRPDDERLLEAIERSHRT